jgi:hypothetical protein
MYQGTSPKSTGKCREGVKGWRSTRGGVTPGGACDRGTTPGALRNAKRTSSSNSGSSSVSSGECAGYNTMEYCQEP